MKQKTRQNKKPNQNKIFLVFNTKQNNTKHKTTKKIQKITKPKLLLPNLGQSLNLTKKTDWPDDSHQPLF